MKVIPETHRFHSWPLGATHPKEAKIAYVCGGRTLILMIIKLLRNCKS
jgi:hypothetical protein